MALTARQERFVDEYLIDLNATQAYIRAGYSARGAEQNACLLMRNHKVTAAIATRQSARAADAELSEVWVLDRLRENVARAMQAEPVRDSKGKETGEYVYQGQVANRALELIGKHRGMFTEKHEHRFPDLPKEQRVDRLAAILNGARERAKATNGSNGKHP